MSLTAPLGDFANARYRTMESYGFAPDLLWIPLNDSEFHITAHNLPLAILIVGTVPRLGALLHPSFLQRPMVGEQGRWLLGYVPIALRTYPFLLAAPRGPRPIDEIDLVVASDRVGSQGVPICSDPVAGVLGPEVEAVRQTLLLMRSGSQRLTRALDLVMASDVLVALRPPAPEAPTFYTIDPSRVAGLSRRSFTALGRESFLPLDLIASLVFSRRHLHPDRRPTNDSTVRVESAAPRGETIDFALANLESMDYSLDASELFTLDDFVPQPREALPPLVGR